MMMDPLVGAVCNPLEIWQMTDEMLVAQEKWLPQYKKAIVKAKENLSKDDLIPAKNYLGAARLKTKTVDEMSLDKEKARNLAGAAEKAGL